MTKVNNKGLLLSHSTRLRWIVSNIKFIHMQGCLQVQTELKF